MAADIIQVCQDVQVVLWGGGAAAAAEQVIVEQVNRRARGVGTGGSLQRTTKHCA